ncbi:MAG TPA: cohesin domain-containing protein [Geobacteraceae bacterium]
MQLAKKLTILICSLTVLGGCAPGLTTFDKGQKLEQKGDLDQAVIKYAEAAAANPGVSEIRLRFLKVSAESARRHLSKGDEFLAIKNYDDALREYQTAFALDPSLDRAKQQGDVAGKLRNSQIFFKEGAELEKNLKPREALRSYQKAVEFSPANKEAKEGIDRLSKTRHPKPDSFELNLKSNKPITLKFKDAKIKDVFNIISQLSGINFIFDEAVKDQNFSIHLENATFYQALDVITELNKLGKKVLNENTIIIYPRNSEKSKQYDELYLQTFYLNKIEAKKAINLLRTMMQIKKIYVNEELNAIVIRDTPEVVALVGKILEANDIPDAEVILEVEVIELSKTNSDNLGFVLSRYALSTEGFNNGTPFSDVLSATTSTTTSTTTTTAGPSNLLQMFAWRQFSGFLTVPNATFNFAKTLANGESLANPRIRVKNREKAKFNSGSRIPITTTSSPTGGGVNVNVQYVDVGVKLNAEPIIQLNDDITIKLSLEVSTAGAPQTVGGAGSATTVVTIGTRNLDTVLSLKDGETSIIGGLIQDNRSKNSQKISLLGDIPLIGSILSGNDRSNQKTELVLAITPHIVRGVAVPDPSVSAFWSGKEDEPSTTKLFSSFGQENEPAPVSPDAAASVPATVVPAPPQAAGKVLTPTKVPPPPAAPAPSPEATRANEVPSVGTVPSVLAAQPQTPTTGSGSPLTKSVRLNISAPSAVKVNDEFRVEAVVSDANNLNNALFTLVFDPAYLDLVGATEGTFLKSDGKPTTFRPNLHKDKGVVEFNLSRMGNVGGLSGSGTLVVITFKAKAKGAANIGFSGVDFSSPEKKAMNVDLYSSVVEIK